jgi:iron complex outermembrane receptor protein
VISFFAKLIAPGSYELQLDGGSRDAKHAYASAGIPLARALTAMVSGDYLDGGGYRMIAPDNAGPVDRRSEISSRNGMARVEYAPSQHLSGFVAGNFYNDNRDLGTALAHTNRDDRRVTFGADLSAASYGALTLRGWNGVLVEDQWASLVTPTVGRSAERQTSWQHIPTHDWGASLQWARDGVLGLGTLLAGADVRKMTGDVAEEDYAANGSVSANIQSGGSQLLSGAFVQGILSPVEPLRIEVGGRYDRWGNNDGFSVDANGRTIYPDATYEHFSPRLGATYRVSSMLTLRGALYDAFRAPNLAEMYRKFVSGTNTNLPNPALRPESARGQEAGFDLQPASWMQLRGTYYSAIYSDFNSFVTISPGTRQRQNVQRSRSTGGEAYLALRPIEPLLLSASVNYDHAVVVTNDANPASVGSYIGRVPQQRQVIRATYATPAIGSLTALWRHEGKNSTFNGTQLDPFTVVDANYTRDITRGLSAFVSVENVGDVKYQVNFSGGVVSLGLPRTVRIGVRAGKE